MEKCTSSLEIIRDYFTFRLNESHNLNKLYSKNSDDYFRIERESGDNAKIEILTTIRMLGFEAEQQNRDCYDNFINYLFSKIRLDELQNNDFYFLVVKLQEVGNALFGHRGENNGMDWARILAFISFVSYLSFKFAWLSRDMTQTSACTCKLIEWLTSFLTCKCGLWIECNGGWVSLF